MESAPDLTTRTIAMPLPTAAASKSVKRVITRRLDIDMNHATQLADLRSGEWRTKPSVAAQIAQKLGGYRQQDCKKERYDETAFVTLDDVVERLAACGLLCIFCGGEIYTMYEDVRDGRQWTLDRIDNLRGHNVDNVDIACLDCNLRRRCKSQDNFMRLKNMQITRVID